MTKKKEMIVRESAAPILVDRDMLILQLVIACEGRGKQPTRDQLAQVLSHQSQPFHMKSTRVIVAITTLRQSSIGYLNWAHDKPLSSTEKGRAAAQEVARPQGFEALVQQLLRCIEASQRLTTQSASPQGGATSK